MRVWNKLPPIFLVGVLLAGLLAGCQSGETIDPDDIAYRTAHVTRTSTLVKINGTDVTADEGCEGSFDVFIALDTV